MDNPPPTVNGVHPTVFQLERSWRDGEMTGWIRGFKSGALWLSLFWLTVLLCVVSWLTRRP
jgi:hypothetical protein